MIMIYKIIFVFFVMFTSNLFAGLDLSQKSEWIQNNLAILEPEDGKLHHGGWLITYESSGNLLAGYLSISNNSAIRHTLRNFFIGMPGERALGKPSLGQKNLFDSAASTELITEISPFTVTPKYKEELKKTKYIRPPIKTFATIDTIPLTELGTEKWKNYEGGLYSNGSNVRPHKHDSAGIEIAKSIVPLDENGEIDYNFGKIVLLSIGMSNATQEFSKFKQLADTFALKNPKMVIVDGAQGGQTAAIISNPNANFWNVASQRLQSAGVNEKQVQVVWLKEADANPTQEFPIHAQILKNELKSIVQILKQKYPNIKIAYLSSRTYGGYATTKLNPEPYAYESGFSIKWLIEEQINGDTALSFDGNNPKAPFLSWGPYLWAKGTTQRNDGLVWLREDFGADGTHPSESGRLKVANLLLNFLISDSTSRIWFLSSFSNVVEQKQPKGISISPNPASDYIEIYLPLEGNERGTTEIKIYNTLGEYVLNVVAIHKLPLQQQIDISHLPAGVYFVRIGKETALFVKI